MTAASLFLALGLAARAAPVVTINYPQENDAVGTAKSVYIYGNVQPPTAALKINGEGVKPDSRGAFIAFLPVQPGTFTFHCEATVSTETATADRRITVARSPSPSPADRKVLEDEFTLPKSPLELRPGDWLQVQVKATAGMAGTYDIKGVQDDLPLVEQSTAGLYLGAYQIRPGDKADQAEIRFTLKGGVGKIKTTAPGTLTIPQDSPRVAYAWPRKEEQAVVRTGPGTGYMLFLSTGTRFVVDGRNNSEVRVRLSESETGWVDASQIKFFPPGTPPPQAVLSTVKTEAAGHDAAIHLALSDKVPYLVEQTEPDRLKVKLYDTYAYVNWMIYDPQDSLVKELRWRQSASGTAEVEIRLNAPLWGYEAGYEAGGLRLLVRPAPEFAPAPQSPLKGRTIILDPGHSPSDPGRITPMGHTEREFNLMTAVALKPLLEKEGAKVVMTRDNNDAEVSLQERVHLAVNNRADAFISLHNNALPPNGNPLEADHGYGVYYYHPLSLDLAERVHAEYQKGIKLADEGLHYGNIMVARMSYMPSILVESAYFILPAQEALLETSAFHDKLAKAIVKGLKGFFESERKAQKARPKPAPAPEPAPKPKTKKAAPKKAAPKAAPAKKAPAKKKAAAPAAPKRPKPKKIKRPEKD